MSVHKANRFIKAAKSNGWTTKYWIVDDKTAYIRVRATRGPETLTIEWVSNQLNGPPIYKFHEMELKVHSRLDAERILAKVKPDLDRYHKWQNRKKPKRALDAVDPLLGGAQDTSTTYDPADLPFDPESDPDSVILKAIRGNTILFRNSISRTTESVFVPYKISDSRRGVRMFNTDHENVFFLAENDEGRAWLSFMDAEGQFRAVHLDRILAVV